MNELKQILHEIRACKHCEPELPLGARPVLSAHSSSKIVIIGQAPGLKVHQTGIPWDDRSGDNLRAWLQVEKHDFYNPERFALIPMGFCYPGKGKSGDLPPRAACAPLWHQQVLARLKHAQLTLLVGQYAQQFYLKDNPWHGLSETVRNYQSFLPLYFPLPHPSPRNNIWMAKNPWFKQEVLPDLGRLSRNILAQSP